MADHPVARLGGKTLLQYADTPNMDMLARTGRTGRLTTIPDGFQPGSEVANTAILGYDLNQVYEGRGPLEAASIGYEMRPDDLALRCNIITLENGLIKNHHGGHLTTEDSDVLIKHLNKCLGNDNIHFITGTQYRHLLIIRNGNKHIECAPPHDHPNEPWRNLMVKPKKGWEELDEDGRMSAQETADIINKLIIESQYYLAQKQSQCNEQECLSIWPWGGGYRPKMKPLSEIYPQVKSGSVISAVDLIRGIGHYAGLRIIKVKGATGLANTNYGGKTQAALEALRTDDFVFLHIEASDEAGHDGDLDLKLKTIENLDKRVVGPIFKEKSPSAALISLRSSWMSTFTMPPEPSSRARSRKMVVFPLPGGDKMSTERSLSARQARKISSPQPRTSCGTRIFKEVTSLIVKLFPSS